MFINEQGYIEMEQNPVGDEGRVLDSCAETSRVKHLAFCCTWKGLHDGYSYLGAPNPTLRNFYVDGKFVRWPGSTKDDFSSDQAVPLMLAAKACNVRDLAMGLYEDTIVRGYRTGDGNFVTPLFLGVMQRSFGEHTWGDNIALIGQALLFKFPWRWDDGQKKLASTKDSSADYLNWCHAVLQRGYLGDRFIFKACVRLVGKDTLLGKIRSYYKPEPNSGWLLDLYERVLEAAWK